MERLAVFDLDGTLCAHHCPVTHSTAVALRGWKKRSGCEVVVSTASPLESVAARAGALLGVVDKFYCSHGNVVLDGYARLTWESHAPDLPETLDRWLRAAWETRWPYPLDTGNVPFYHAHGCTSFSFLGKRYSLDARREYIKSELKLRERERLLSAYAYDLKPKSIELTWWNARRGGQTGVDFFWDPGKGGKFKPVFDASSACDFLYFGDDVAEMGGDRDALEECSALGRPENFVYVGAPAHLEEWLEIRSWRSKQC